MSGHETSAHDRYCFDEEGFGLAQILLSFFLHFRAGLSDKVWLIKSSDQKESGTGLGHMVRGMRVCSCCHQLPHLPPPYLKPYSCSEAKGQSAGKFIPCSCQT